MNPPSDDSSDATLARLLADFEDEAPSRDRAAEADLTPSQQKQLRDLQQFLQVVDRVWPRQTTPEAPPSYNEADHLGHFELVRLLGRGGFGEVYLAFDQHLCREVALKIPRTHLLSSPQLHARFVQEAQAAAKVAHPNIVSVFEANQLGEIWYIASEFCPGPTLVDYLEKTRPGFAWSARLIAAIADGVAHAHDGGILHRDIKPSNILLFPRGENCRDGDPLWDVIPKLTDFGLAKDLFDNDPKTTAELAIGTPKYMAPEQADGRNADVGPSSDIYSLGVVLYEMLTGCCPFTGSTKLETLYHVRTRQPIPPREHNRNIPVDLETICLKCLRKDPSSRYATARLLAEDLTRFLENKPIRAKANTATDRLNKWRKRHPLASGLLTTFLFTTATCSAALWWNWPQVRGVWDRFDLTVPVSVDTDNSAEAAELEKQLLQRDLRARQYEYVVAIRNADNAWRSGDITQMQSLLDAQIPKPGQADIRQFDWYYLRQLQGRVPSVVCEGHVGAVYATSFASDDHLLASAGQDGTVRLWDAATGKQLRSTHAGLGQLEAVCFARHDTCVAVAGQNGQIRLFEVRSLMEVETLDGHDDLVTSLDASADGELLLSGCDDGSVALWDLQSGKLVREISAHQGSTESVRFGYRDREFITGGNDRRLRIWKLNTGQLLREYSHMETVSAIAYGNGNKIAAGGEMFSARCYNSGDPKTPTMLFNGHTDPVRGLDFSENGHYLASCGKFGMARVWNTNDGSVDDVFRVDDERAWSIDHSNGQHRQLATAGNNGQLKIWDLDTRPDRKIVLEMNKKRVRCFQFLSDDSIIVGGDGLVARVDNVGPSKTSRITWIIDREGSPLGWKVAVSPDRKKVVAAAHGELLILDAGTGTISGSTAVHDSSVNALCVSPKGNEIAVATQESPPQLIDLETLESRTLVGPSATEVLYSNDASHLYCVGGEGSVRTHELSTGMAVKFHNKTIELQTVLRRHPKGDNVLLTGGHDRQITFRDLRELEPLYTLHGFESNLLDVSWHPSGDMIAAADLTSLTLWHLPTRQKSLTLLSGQEIFAVKFSPDGTYLLGAMANSLVLWGTTPCGGATLERANVASTTSSALHPKEKRLARRLWRWVRGNLLLDQLSSPGIPRPPATGTFSVRKRWHFERGDVRKSTSVPIIKVGSR